MAQLENHKDVAVMESNNNNNRFGSSGGAAEMRSRW